MKYLQITPDQRRDLYMLMKRLEISKGQATTEDVLRLTKLFGLLNTNILNLTDITIEDMYEFLKEVNKVYKVEELPTKRVYTKKERVYEDNPTCQCCLEAKPLNRFRISVAGYMYKICLECQREKDRIRHHRDKVLKSHS